jgi:hypothetical protein
VHAPPVSLHGVWVLEVMLVSSVGWPREPCLHNVNVSVRGSVFVLACMDSVIPGIPYNEKVNEK